MNSRTHTSEVKYPSITLVKLAQLERYESASQEVPESLVTCSIPTGGKHFALHYEAMKNANIANFV